MSRKSQIKRLDRLWSKAVVERDKSICQKCGEFGDNPHHVILRRYLAIRWCLANGLTLCTKCHRKEAHDKPWAFFEWFKETFPNRYEAMQELKHEIKTDLDEVEAKLKGEI